MKLLLFTCALALCTTISAQTRNDTMAIREACINYVGGFYNNDSKRIEKSVHPELAKRIAMSDSIGGSMIRSMGLTELTFAARRFKKADDGSGAPFSVDVIIYDISNGIATAKISQNKMKFFDYAQLAKMDGNWKIINVLWTRTE